MDLQVLFSIIGLVRSVKETYHSFKKPQNPRQRTRNFRAFPPRNNRPGPNKRRWSWI